MYVCVCVCVYNVRYVQCVSVVKQARGSMHSINMPRFGRMAVSLYSLGLWWCGKGATLHPVRACWLMRLSSDLIRAF